MIVFIPGATGGGPYITKLRIWLHDLFGEKIYIPSSVSTKHGFKPGETLDQRYTRLASEIKRNEDDDLVIMAHSLGTLEIAPLLDKLKVIPKKIILISPPLINFKWVLGFIKLFFFPAFYEQASIKNNTNFLKRFVRSLKVHKYIQDEYHGVFVPETDHNLMLERYIETIYDKNFLSKYRKFLFSNLRNLFFGIEFPKQSEIAQIVLENDPTTISYPGVQKKIFLSGSGHSSFGYQPDILKGLTDLFNL